MKKRVMMAGLAVAMVVAVSTNLFAADGTHYDGTWGGWFDYWTIYAIQTVAGWFGKCYPGLDGTCIQP